MRQSTEKSCQLLRSFTDLRARAQPRWPPPTGSIYCSASRELIAALSGEVLGCDGDTLRAAERLAGEIVGLDRTSLRHLEDEEDLIIPLILERTRDDPHFS